MSWTLGCDVCREGVFSGGEPQRVVITADAGPLYRCRTCRTWWVGDMRQLHPVTDEVVRARFPREVSGG